MTQGLVFSGQLLQDLVEHGAPREDAYKWVQGHAMEAWENDLNFRERIYSDTNVRRYLDEAALNRAFDLSRHLRYVNEIFARVLAAASMNVFHSSYWVPRPRCRTIVLNTSQSAYETR